VTAVASRRPTRVLISRSALEHNLGVMRTLAQGAKLCAILKSDGYGHGATTIASVLGEGVDLLAVALLDEALELREADVTVPILILSEVPLEHLALAIEQGFTLTVSSLAGAQQVRDTVAGTSAEVRVHIKVDTGMYRQGVAPHEVTALAQVLLDADVLIEGLYTHFPVADGESEEARNFTAAQSAQLDDALAHLRALGLEVPLVHEANSAASIAHPRSHRSMIRSGLTLYGYAPEPWLAEELARRGLTLRPVLRLTSAVTALRRVSAGERPSYGRARALPADATVVTIPVGYADGYPRLLSTSGEVLIRGQRFPLAGRVTMDQIVVDVGDAPVQVGDEVVLLGSSGDESIDAQDWARWSQTVHWEILTRLGPRIVRVVVD